ncbi:MAG: hypothetical protein FWH05_04720, partial [Oscillospiraceae bacterium]|nr:hypothetical protein [Oscillospiraceae bacterium]
MKKLKATILALSLMVGLTPGVTLNVAAASFGANIDMSDTNPPSSGTGWTFSNDVYTISGNVTVTGNNGETKRRLAVAANVTASITLNNATIEVEPIGVGGEPSLLLGNNANLTLNIVGTNTLIGNVAPGINVPFGTTLVIGGTGSLTAEGLTSAGIGGNYNQHCGTVIINSGTVTAIGRDANVGVGAGIGGGGNSGNGGNVIINGGTVTATGGNTPGLMLGAAGIGGGCTGGTGGTVTINGGTVTAIGGTGAPGIGSGPSQHITGNLIMNGNATVFTNTLTGSSEYYNLRTNTAGVTLGILFEGNRGVVYGNVSLSQNITIPDEHTLTVMPGSTLTINSGRKLTNNGIVDNYGTINHGGTYGEWAGNPYNSLVYVPSSEINLSAPPDVNFGDGWEFSANVYTILDGANVTVTGNSRTSQRRLAVAANAAANITLNNVTITDLGLSQTPLELLNNTNVTLTIEGMSRLTANGSAGILVPATATLTIEGTGDLAVRGGNSCAGIGGTTNVRSGTININNGAIDTKGGDGRDDGAGAGAGIGGGGGGADTGLAGNINISGGNVTATGGSTGNTGGAPGIGAGERFAADFNPPITISLSGGMITAKGGVNAACIGRGSLATGGSGDSDLKLNMSGNAVVYVLSLANGHNIRINTTEVTQGILFEGTSGTVYGNASLTHNLMLPNTNTLTIPSNKSLTVIDGIMLTNFSTISNDGTITNAGTINGSGTITNNGEINCLTGEISNTVNGNKANIIGIVFPMDLTALIGERLSDIDLSKNVPPFGSFEWVTPTAFAGETLGFHPHAMRLSFANSTNYNNEETVEVKVVGLISDADVNVTGSYTYNGTAITPNEDEVEVLFEDEPLEHTKDYTILPTNNINAGFVIFTIEGAGLYIGKLSVPYEIKKADFVVGDFVYTEPPNLIEDGNAKTATVVFNPETSSGKSGYGDLSVPSYIGTGDTNYPKSTVAPLLAGQYDVLISTTGATNFNNADDLVVGSFAIVLACGGNHTTENQEEVDADCTIDLVCICGYVLEEGKEEHTSDNAQDDDCELPNTCTFCPVVIDTGKSHVSDNAQDDDCEQPNTCTFCPVVIDTEKSHEPNTPIDCTDCKNCEKTLAVSCTTTPKCAACQTACEHTDRNGDNCENCDDCGATGLARACTSENPCTFHYTPPEFKPCGPDCKGEGKCDEPCIPDDFNPCGEYCKGFVNCDEPCVFLIGDTNRDGRINIADLTYLKL